ncbi:MAG: DedA family protein [Thermaerobacter sp.]|nr:DedA family protein [Thermaerobacter sp.]
MLFLILLIESVGIPSPSEISLIGAGVLASEGRLSLPLVILAGALGSIAGAHISYLIAKRGGRRLILRYGVRVGLTDERLKQAEKFFHGRGDIAILVGRLISGVRAIISYPAGLFDMPYPRFLVFTSIGAVLWPIIAAGAGYLVGPHYKILVTWISRFWIAILGAGALALIAYIIVRRRRRRKGSTGA